MVGEVSNSGKNFLAITDLFAKKHSRFNYLKTPCSNPPIPDSQDSRESFQGSRTAPFFCESRFGGAKNREWQV